MSALAKRPSIALMAQPDLIIDRQQIAYWHDHYTKVLKVALNQPRVVDGFVERVEEHIALCDMAYRRSINMRASV